MKQHNLIPVVPGKLGGESTQLVDARRLHAFLGVGRDFSNWIKGRIEEFGFEKNQDYLLAKSSGYVGKFDSPILGNQTADREFDSPNPANQMMRGGNRRSVDYFITLDMAKELAMVERTVRGKQARRYFIDCERQLRQMQSHFPSWVPAQQVELTRGQHQAINRQAWADISAKVQDAFHARREELISAIEPRLAAPRYVPMAFVPTWAR